jgi:hypothetical protein
LFNRSISGDLTRAKAPKITRPSTIKIQSS